MGATGTGKSKLPINLANNFPIEVVNRDNIKVYKSTWYIVTNKGIDGLVLFFFKMTYCDSLWGPLLKMNLLIDLWKG